MGQPGLKKKSCWQDTYMYMLMCLCWCACKLTYICMVLASVDKSVFAFHCPVMLLYNACALLAAGYYVNRLPPWLTWSRYLSIVCYPFNALSLLELGDLAPLPWVLCFCFPWISYHPFLKYHVVLVVFPVYCACGKLESLCCLSICSCDWLCPDDISWTSQPF